MGCQALLQGIFLTQGSNLCFLHWQADFYHCITWEAQDGLTHQQYNPLPIKSLYYNFLYGETMQTVTDFIFLGSQITADGDCSHEIKVMTNLDSLLKSTDITFPTKVCLVKAMTFPVVMYGCESWTSKKAEHHKN